MALAKSPMSKRSPRVVVAEDQLELRELLAEMFRDEGYAVTEAKDGPALLDILIDTLDNAVGCSGLEVLARLRRFHWATRVIVITAFGDPDAHLRAHRLGATLVLDKPFDLATLRTAARTLAPLP